MPGLTSFGQQFSTWATGDILVYAATVGFVIAGIMCWRLGAGLGAFFCVIIGTAIAFGGSGIATSIRGFVGSGATTTSGQADVPPSPVQLAAHIRLDDGARIG